MPISREEEFRRFKQLQRLNYFYAMTVVLMTVSLLFLLFNINAEQRKLIDETAFLVEQRATEAEEFDRKAELRLERSLARFEDIENLIITRMEMGRLEALEKRVEELINELEQ